MRVEKDRKNMKKIFIKKKDVESKTVGLNIE